MEPIAPRVAPLAEREWDEISRKILRSDRSREKPIANVYSTLARYPHFLKAWVDFGEYILRSTALQPEDTEFVVLRTAWLRRCTYVWSHHLELAYKVGLVTPDSALEIFDVDRRSESQSILLDATDELIRDGALSAAVWARVSAEFSDVQVVDLIATVGQYNLLASLLNSLGVPLEPEYQDARAYPPLP